MVVKLVSNSAGRLVRTSTSTSTNDKVDAWLSKAIRRMVLVSFAVHFVLLAVSNAKSTGGWLDTFTTANFWIPDTILSSTRANTADIRAPHTTHRIPLEDLIRSNPNPGALCNNTDGNSEKHLIESTILPENVTYSSHRRIPKIVHVTSKSACMTPAFIENIATWRFPGYALYFHDDVAVDRLLAKYWPEFPQLQLFQKCSVSGAAKADIWRLLVIWEYGGIYTDIDNAPGPKFDEGNIIQDDDDAWFVVERIGVLSQYFMAASPKHPLIYAGLTQLFQRLLDVENIREQYVPFVTGPGTMKSAMIYFMIDDKEHNYTKVTKGKYVGFGGRSVTIDGTPQTSNEYVIRESVRGIHKSKGYTAMGMVHFSAKEGRDEWPTSSCHEHLYMETIKLLDKEQYHLAAVEDSSSW